jgi:hypothetical protein
MKGVHFIFHCLLKIINDLLFVRVYAHTANVQLLPAANYLNPGVNFYTLDDIKQRKTIYVSTAKKAACFYDFCNQHNGILIND